MEKSIYLHEFRAIAAALLAITLSAPMTVHAQTSKHSEPHRHDSKIQIPEAMRLEQTGAGFLLWFASAQGTTGLFHLAIAYQRFICDPDENRAELYCDRPRKMVAHA